MVCRVLCVCNKVGDWRGRGRWWFWGNLLLRALRAVTVVVVFVIITVLVVLPGAFATGTELVGR